MASQETLDKQCILLKLRYSNILSIKAHGGGGTFDDVDKQFSTSLSI
jgi:hypothetical protein